MPVQWAPGFACEGDNDDHHVMDADVEALTSVITSDSTNADTAATGGTSVTVNSGKELKSSKSCFEVGRRLSGEAFIPSREYQQMHNRVVDGYDDNDDDDDAHETMPVPSNGKTCMDLGARGALNVGGAQQQPHDIRNEAAFGPRLHLDRDGEPCLNTRLLKVMNENHNPSFSAACALDSVY